MPTFSRNQATWGKPSPSPDLSKYPFDRSSPTSRYFKLAIELGARASGPWAVVRDARCMLREIGNGVYSGQNGVQATRFCNPFVTHK